MLAVVTEIMDLEDGEGITMDTPLGPDEALLFLHIPKTAGTAMRTALGSLYPPERRAYLYDAPGFREAVPPDQFPLLPADRLRDLRLVMGHVPYGIHASLPQPSRYVSMLRDPVDRLVSMFYFYREVGFTRAASLTDWVFGTCPLQADNEMVRMISGRGKVPFGKVDESMYHEAIEHVERRFGALLVRGMMAESMRAMERLIGQPMPALKVENRTGKRPAPAEVDATVRERIAALNRYDADLFRYARDRLAAG